MVAATSLCAGCLTWAAAYGETDVGVDVGAGADVGVGEERGGYEEQFAPSSCSAGWSLSDESGE